MFDKILHNELQEIISKLKQVFANFGIPQCIVSDNSPFNSALIHNFYKQFNIYWKYSSPNYPQSNGMSERIKEGCLDYLELLAEYSATPIMSVGL